MGWVVTSNATPFGWQTSMPNHGVQPERGYNAILFFSFPSRARLALHYVLTTKMEVTHVLHC
jgi:hypothetical protein